MFIYLSSELLKFMNMNICPFRQLSIRLQAFSDLRRQSDMLTGKITVTKNEKYLICVLNF